MAAPARERASRQILRGTVLIVDTPAKCRSELQTAGLLLGSYAIAAQAKSQRGICVSFEALPLNWIRRRFAPMLFPSM